MPRKKWQRSSLHRAPGSRLRRLAQLFFSVKANEEIFLKILDAMRDEHFKALAAGDQVLAKFTLLRGYVHFWLAVGGLLPVSFIKLFF
jgi:hypothetical protein